MKKNKVSGFTLIELLVVITIIGILAVGGVSVYTQQMAKARDSTRIRDIKTLQTAIESAYSNTNTYVATTPATFTGAIKPYTGAQGIPSDPVGKNATTNAGADSCVGKNATFASTDLCVYAYLMLNSGEGYYLSNTFEVTNSLANTDKLPSGVTNNNNRYEIFGGNPGTVTAGTYIPGKGIATQSQGVGCNANVAGSSPASTAILKINNCQ